MQRLRLIAKRIIRRGLLHGFFTSRRFEFQPMSGNEVSVLACLWNRPSRLRDMLELLDAQDHVGGVRLYLWNNNKADHTHYLSVLADFRASGALKRVDIVKTPFNLGSIARFYWARKIAKPGVPLIVFDDDQNIEPGFVSTAISTYKPGVVSAWWAWRITGNYWERVPAEPGESADHVGPGGMICDSGIFTDKRFFLDLPEKYWFLDDIWLSHFVKSGGYRLEKLPVTIAFVMDETNQYHTQVQIKPEFYDYLQHNAARA